jgi:hypothetical protein
MRSTTASPPAPTRSAGQQINDTLDVARIDAVVRKWLARLPQPFTRARA